MPAYTITNQEEYPVTAYLRDTGELVGTFPNASKAARALFIRHASTIYLNLLRAGKRKKTGRPAGVKSKKTGLIYIFKYSK